jgi:hypothetical protein
MLQHCATLLQISYSYLCTFVLCFMHVYAVYISVVLKRICCSNSEITCSCILLYIYHVQKWCKWKAVDTNGVCFMLWSNLFVWRILWIKWVLFHLTDGTHDLDSHDSVPPPPPPSISLVVKVEAFEDICLQKFCSNSCLLKAQLDPDFTLLYESRTSSSFNILYWSVPSSLRSWAHCFQIFFIYVRGVQILAMNRL